MNQYIPPIEGGTNDTSTGLKTTISPIQAKHDKEAENHIYFDPLKKYAFFYNRKAKIQLPESHMQ